MIRYSFIAIGIVFAFIMLSLSSAIGLGVSPSEISVSGEIGKIVCKEIIVFSSIEGLKIGIKDKWTDSGSERELEKYYLDAEDVGVYSTYEDSFSSKRERAIEYCLSADKSGNYNGLIIFSPSQGNLEVGSWINANFYSSKERSKITGLSVEGGEENEEFNIGKVILPMTFFNVVLLLVLIVVFLRKKR